MDTLTLAEVSELIKNGNHSEFFYTIIIDDIKESDRKILSDLESMCNISIIPIKYQVTYFTQKYRYFYFDEKYYSKKDPFTEDYTHPTQLQINVVPVKITTFEKQEYKIIIYNLMQGNLTNIDLSLISYNINQVQECKIIICEECYNAIVKQLYILENNGFTIECYIDGDKKIDQKKFKASILNCHETKWNYTDRNLIEKIINDIRSYKIKITPPA